MDIGIFTYSLPAYVFLPPSCFPPCLGVARYTFYETESNPSGINT